MSKGDYKTVVALSEKELDEELGIEDVANLTYEEATVNPRIKQTAGLIKFWWGPEQVQAGVSRIHQHKDGRVTAEVKFTTTAPGFPNHLHQAQINLVATRAKKELATHLTSQRNDLDWETVVEELSREVLERVRQGEPVIVISTVDEVEQPGYVIDPIVPEDQPTIIYGLGGSGKSTLALVCGIAVQLPWQDNKLGLEIKERKGVMYLDWETNHTEITWRMKAICKGMGLNYVSIHYRRCAMPLADDTEAIQRAILENNIGFVIIDSVGAACGGDLNAAEPAIRMFTALRELKVTSLLVAHTSKNPATKETSVYGSAFFNFYARSVWEMKKVQEAGDKGLKVGLYHRKANMSELRMPLGFEMGYSRDRSQIRIEAINVGKVSELAEHLPIKARIKDMLKETGKMEVKELAGLLGITEAVARTKLYELLRANQVVKMDKHWGVAANV